MKRAIGTMIVVIIAGIIVYIGYSNIAVNTKDAIVDHREYLGNRSNPQEIYAGPSDGRVYSPMNIDLIPMDKLMLIDIADDPEYACIELQIFDDIRGRGARVLLYHHDGPADSYYTGKAFELEGLQQAKSFIDPAIDYHMDVTDSGLKATLKMQDYNGRPIEFQVRETQRHKWSKGFLAPIGASDAIAFDHFPFFHMKDMNFVRRSGTTLLIKIGGEVRKPKKLPIPADGEFVYLTRYSPGPVMARWNRPHNGALNPLGLQGQSSRQEGQITYAFVNNDGHNEIRTMRGFNGGHEAGVDFSPPIPDLASLKHGAEIEGRFCAGADGIPGIVAGTYLIKRRGNTIDMEIRPREGWQPTPGSSWVKTWIWKGTITVAPDSTASMKSGWARKT